MDDSPADVNSLAAPSRDSSGSAPANPKWTFSGADPLEDPTVETFIRHGFEDAYGSQLAQLMPEIMVLRRHSEIAAACGLRAAAMDRLFLEVYLDRPVEAVLGVAADTSV